MAMNGPGLGDEIASALSQSPTTQMTGFGKGIVEAVQQGTATFGNIPGPHPISGVSFSTMASLIQGYAGYPSVSPELSNFCDGIATHVMTGTVTYSGPPPSPPVIMPPAAWFLGGVISGLSGSAMASLVASKVGYPSVSSELTAMCNAIANHIMTNAQVVSGVIS